MISQGEGNREKLPFTQDKKIVAKWGSLWFLKQKKKLSLRIFYFSSELINDITYNLQWNNEAIIVTTYVLTR